MELREFIKTALLEITDGVADAQKEAKHGTISPAGIQQTADSVKLGVSALTAVEFEVHVTVDKGTGSRAKLGVLSSFVGAGIEGNSSNDSSRSSTLKFRIPVLLPKAQQQ